MGESNYFNCIGIQRICSGKYKKTSGGEDEENSDFRIYPDYHKIYRGQTEIVLTKAEYELFMLLSGRPGVIFTKEKIFEILYNEELPESIDNIVYCLVSSMRKKNLNRS